MLRDVELQAVRGLLKALNEDPERQRLLETTKIAIAEVEKVTAQLCLEPGLRAD